MKAVRPACQGAHALAVLALLWLCGAAAAEPLRVQLTGSAIEARVTGPLLATVDRQEWPAAEVSLSASGAGLVVDGRPLPSGLRLRPSAGTPLRLELRWTPGVPAVPREYRGELVVHAQGGRLAVVNHVDLEDYLRGVVPREIGRGAPPAALAAQAVAARTYALYRRRAGHATTDFPVVNTQAYEGVSAETPAADAAVAATAGEVLWRGGKPLEALFHACCGGVCAAPEEVWPGSRSVAAPLLDLPEPASPRFDPLRLLQFLTSPADRAWCQTDRAFRWQRTFTLAELQRRFAKALARAGADGLRDVTVERRGPSGRVVSLALQSRDGVVRVTGDSIRWLFGSGNDALPSTLFVVTAEGEQRTFSGGGWGHGLGLCQAGAIGQANAGRDYRAIVAHYYPGAQLAVATP